MQSFNNHKIFNEFTRQYLNNENVHFGNLNYCKKCNGKSFLLLLKNVSKPLRQIVFKIMPYT